MQKKNGKNNLPHNPQSQLLEPLNPDNAEDHFQLKYEAQPNIQGQCLLKKIAPIRISSFKMFIFIISVVFLVGTPLLFIFWFPELKKRFYYRNCQLAQASNLYIENNDGQVTYPKKQTGFHNFNEDVKKQVVFFINRYLKYVIEGNLVKAASYDYYHSVMKIRKYGSKGLNENIAQDMRYSYGIGAMMIKTKSLGKLFIDETMRPLYLFIICSCILWLQEEYYYYCGMIFLTAGGGILTSLWQTYQLNKKIYSMAFFETEVNILRDSKIESRSSRDVVPGDIVFFKKPIKIPFDGILLEGTILVNECSITGESIPIVKKSEQSKKVESEKDFKNSLLFEGSQILQVNSSRRFVPELSKLEQYRQQYGLPVYVVKTNFITMKGQLIRIISFPVQKTNQFERESVRFLLFLFCLTVVSYVFMAMKLASDVGIYEFVFKFLDLVTVTVPPGLPLSMTFGIIYALEKMKVKKIFCISPNKTILGGMTNLVCFDKTGTLTEDFMDFNSLIPVSISDNLKPQMMDQEIIKEVVFTQIISKQREKNIEQIIRKYDKTCTLSNALNNMATNHTIVRLQTSGQNIGDPMQIKMFEFGEFQLQMNVSQNHEILQKFTSQRGHIGEVYHRFEFDSELFRMSTIASSSSNPQKYYIYTKGSPEQMLSILNPLTVPKNYEKVLKKYASKGFRILAIASAEVPKGFKLMSRAQLQYNLNFDGFEIFENKLKPQTVPALADLKYAEIPCIMITGDNALTASSIGYLCGISDPVKKTYICEYSSKKNMFYLEKFRDSYTENEEEYIMQCRTIQQIFKKLQSKNGQICMTGSCLNQVISLTEQDQQNLKLIMKDTKVFARAKPNDKAKIVSIYQNLFNKTVAMCGDGANDCGALKQADIGLSLSQAEASIAAPFTSQITNISSMVQLLKQCRAGLATNFSLFNIMAIYSLIQYTTVLITEFFYGFPGDFVYLYWDLGCNFFFIVFIGYTGTAKKLTKQSPNVSLFTVSNITQLMAMFLLQMFGQIGVILALGYYYGEKIGYDFEYTQRQFFEEKNEKLLILDSFEGNALFLFTNNIYIFTMLAFTISKPWRKEFFTNIPFTIVAIIVLIYNSLIIVMPKLRLGIFEIIHMDYMPLNWVILWSNWGLGIIIYVVQKYVLEIYFNRRKVKKNREEGHL